MNFHKYIENASRRTLSDFPFPKQIAFLAGTILGKLFPGMRREVAQDPFAEDTGLLKRLIRNGIYATAFRDGDHQQLRAYFSQYWGQEASSFHQGWQDRFERMFLKHDAVIVDELRELLESGGLGEAHLYEVGCGGGQVLQYLQEQLPRVASFTGIDLGEDQIELNREAYQDSPLQFTAADAVEWIPENAKSNCIVFANGGVFEYFLQSELESLFSYVADKLAPAAVCIIETIATDHDLEKDTGSLIYGRELAFSHNYPRILKEAGFTIVSQSERAGDEEDGGGRWIRVLALAEKS